MEGTPHFCQSTRVKTLKMLPEMPEPIFIDPAMVQVPRLGRVNHVVILP
jgi:hypothetical protein